MGFNPSPFLPFLFHFVIHGTPLHLLIKSFAYWQKKIQERGVYWLIWFNSNLLMVKKWDSKEEVERDMLSNISNKVIYNLSKSFTNLIYILTLSYTVILFALHLLNLKLQVRELTEQFPASIPLALILKQFLADRSLDHSYSGGLSSYCLVSFFPY